MMYCGSVAAAMLVLAAPRALLAQAISIGAGAAVLTTTRTLQGEPGGGVLGLTGQVEAAFAHAGLRADVTVHDGAVFTTLGGAAARAGAAPRARGAARPGRSPRARRVTGPGAGARWALARMPGQPAARWAPPSTLVSSIFSGTRTNSTRATWCSFPWGFG